MDPFKDIQVILSWARGQGANWYDALGALLDLAYFIKGMIPAPSAGVRKMEGTAPAYAGLSQEALANRLEEEAKAYKADPKAVNWGNLLALVLALLKYLVP